ncbi:uncharacterized protein SOCG_02946 [Schizosaccharomyces octosporus yFS286]|uniref:Uncharacterized protein n=1 Tax=Schizosaccharomyces octosporus (strain yFS286) TaxID=483514 RepID=S9Q1Z6_SCHOY|nr:uncharacterized protein SOCG_02946 [Schizosaccharomyces octosporus yFS286]EPX73728.1 hypothetical protein SOCG_02946 [Schizosaccharomyces octosporus yFS286]
MAFRMPNFRKIPMELMPLGAAVLAAAGFATFSLTKKLVADPEVFVHPTTRRTT